MVSRKHIGLGLIFDFGIHTVFLDLEILDFALGGPFCLWIILGDPERSCTCVLSSIFISLFKR